MLWPFFVKEEIHVSLECQAVVRSQKVIGILWQPKVNSAMTRIWFICVVSSNYFKWLRTVQGTSVTLDFQSRKKFETVTLHVCSTTFSCLVSRWFSGTFDPKKETVQIPACDAAKYENAKPVSTSKWLSFPCWSLWASLMTGAHFWAKASNSADEMGSKSASDRGLAIPEIRSLMSFICGLQECDSCEYFALACARRSWCHTMRKFTSGALVTCIWWMYDSFYYASELDT